MLRKGDLVRLVSPASYPEQAHVAAHINTIESWGLRCDTGRHILDEYGYMAGTDCDRLNDINVAFKDPDVKAILTIRGGSGAYRIADDIDFAAVRSNPKPVIGFSDITNLHLALLARCQLGCIHGCIWGDTAQRSVKQLLMSKESVVLQADSDAVSAGVQIPGRAQGRLIGGNLAEVAHAVGVRMPSMEGAILFIEHNGSSGIGTVDRYLTQLVRSGALDGIVGVVLGSFECLRDRTKQDWTVVDVLHDRLEVLNVPVLGGIAAGHDIIDDKGNNDQIALPLGSRATLHANEGTLTIGPIVS